MLRQSLPLFLVLSPLVARAQTQSVPPIVIASGAQIQIPVPANADKPRLQILLGGSTSVLDDERAQVQNGVAVARLEADPGTYDVRVVSNDRTRTPLGLARRFFIPGFKRETGRWLFNGSPVVYQGQNPAPTVSFLPNLRRDKKVKLPFVIPTNTPLKWDVGMLMNNVVDPISHLYVGYTFSGTLFKTKTSTDGPAQLLSATTARDVEELSPQADALVIQGNNQTLLKIARRNVEEAPNFDLPVFAQFQTAPSSSAMLQAFQAGASGLIVPEGTSNSVIDILNRQSARLSGAVTLEDVGLLAKDFDRFAPVLRSAGRVPLLARLPGEGNGDKKDDKKSDDKSAESLLVGFDQTTDQATLDKIERAAKVGATIYCEGTLPAPLWKRWSDITKVQIVPVAPEKQTLSLAEPWFWGTINDQNFDVTQTLALTLKPSVSSQIKEVKGQARETVARSIAHFNGDPNGIMLCPVSKGRIIWAPFDVAPSSLMPIMSRQRTQIGGLLYDNDLEPNPKDKTPTSAQLTNYYAAVAGAMQPALVSFEATRGDASGVSVALRATRLNPDDPKSVAATLVAFFNSSSAPVDLNASVRGDGGFALDLENDQSIPVKVRDFSTRFALTVPANGFRWIVVAKDAKTWNDVGKNSVRARLR